ncbi:MAG: hypothetical protein ACJAS4_003216 [Bacteriovoracaceae bacterium]|jgi:hypothetical protein
MSTLQEKLIETIEKDFAEVKELTEEKQKRKQTSMLLVRIKSAKKVLAGNDEMLKRINKLEKDISKR